MDSVREVFDNSRDFTIGIEEEFAILDPDTLNLVDRFEDLAAAARQDPVLADSVAGELIASEVEIRSGRSLTVPEAIARQEERRRRLFRLAADQGVVLGATGTHPWANYLDQEIIDTPHYQRLKRDLGWVVQRNNTWSLHVHVGIRGADRAIAVNDWLRERLPLLLALSANSIFLDNWHTGLASVRTEIFTRTFPRCGVPDRFHDWDQYAGFIDTIRRHDSVEEAIQLWWSVRPHHAFGTVEVRICDVQANGAESSALATLIAAVVAQTAIDLDEGRLDGIEPLRDREIEENLWRAIRYGMDAEMIDFRGDRQVPARAAVEELVEWTAPARQELGVEIDLPELNGAQRQQQKLADGCSIEAIYRELVGETARSYGTPPDASA